MAETGTTSLEEQFTFFAKFQNSSPDGSTITLTNLDFWLRQAKVLDGKKLTLTDTGVAFNKFKKATIDWDTFLILLENLTEAKSICLEDIVIALRECGLPGADKEKEQQAKSKKGPR